MKTRRKHIYKKYKILIPILLFCLYFSPNQAQNYQSEILKIEKISTNTYIHISYLETESFGKVACNGMVVVDGNEVIIIDTPTTDIVSVELINWVKEELRCEVKGIVVTHFHSDCLGGLNEFHNNKIPSYSNQQTIDLLVNSNKTIPQFGFSNRLELSIGKSKLINGYFGEGHTKDNIVSYFEKDKVLFGGCLIKGQGASKGNLEDANTNEWSITVIKVKSEFKDSKLIIPGHGKVSGTNLLDYTIELFALDK